MAHETVLIVDLGSQYTQLIARRVREARVYCEIVPYSDVTSIREFIARRDTPALGKGRPIGLILSGGPASVYKDHAPTLPPDVLSCGLPVLGICYGMQLGVQALGGKVASAHAAGSGGEYGRMELVVHDLDTVDDPRVRQWPNLFAEFTPGEPTLVWMSHGDRVEDPGPEFLPLASTAGCPFAAVRHAQQPFYGIQFHPEVHHTKRGREILRNFLFGVCHAKGDWEVGSFIESAVAQINAQVGPNGRVICALSGGVDSAVVAVLVHRAIGSRLSCIHVDNGLMRAGETALIERTFREQFPGLDLHVVDATDRFLSQLATVTDPEQKRIRIGHEFIYVFEDEAKKIADIKYLAQGTLYPDVIESVPAHGGPTATIKRHHNVGGLPERMNLELVEPLRFLFKDEVRQIGLELGLPEDMVWRQPFPGPGLAVRILGEVTRERCDVLRHADRIVQEEIRTAGKTREIWQAFAVLLPVKSVGVQGDERTYADTIAVRAVESVDGMTADWAHLPHELLGRIANRIINEVRAVNRVVYDITSKPPGTIEWE